MRAGTARAYNLIAFIALVLFTGGVVFESETLLLSFFLILMVAPVFLHGREVRIQGEKIVLEWGLLFKRRVEILPSEIVDVIDASSTRYLIIARYLPEILLVPLGMIAGGVAIFLTSQYRWVGLAWILFGAVEVVNYLTSPEKKREGAAAVLFITGLLTFVAYMLHSGMVVPLALSGLFMAAIIWEGGPVWGNFLLIVTEKGVYSVTYASKSELNRLTPVLGGGDEG